MALTLRHADSSKTSLESLEKQLVSSMQVVQEQIRNLQQQTEDESGARVDISGGVHADWMRNRFDAMESNLLEKISTAVAIQSQTSARKAADIFKDREVYYERLEASRRQFSMLLRALSQQPLAPRTLFAMLPEHS